MGRIIDAINGSGFTISELALLDGELAISVTGEMESGSFSALLQQMNGQLGDGSVAAATSGVFNVPKPAVPHIECSTLLLIRPHAVKAGMLGRMIDQVLGSGFQVVNLKMVQLTRPNAQEFLEVYKGVVRRRPPRCDRCVTAVTALVALIPRSARAWRHHATTARWCAPPPARGGALRLRGIDGRDCQ